MHNVPVTVRRVQQVLSRDPYLRWSRIKSAPGLTKQHKMTRIKWAGAMAAKDACYWDSVIFSDEKRFRCDGTDGLSKYWADVRKPRRTKMRHQAGGGGIMVWGCISSRGTTKLLLCDDKVNAVHIVTFCRKVSCPS